MDPMPSSAWDIIHSKEKMVEELKGLKETHLRNKAFYDQLLGFRQVHLQKRRWSQLTHDGK
jgi:hypothetical protein